MLQQQQCQLYVSRDLSLSPSLINGTHRTSFNPSRSLREASAQILIVKYDESVTQSKLNLKLVRKVLTVSSRNMKRSGITSSNIPNEII